MTAPIALAAVCASLPALSHLDGAARAQNLFAPVVKVNDRVITAYELSQRIAYLTLLRAPGNPQELARKQLEDEALQREAAKRAGISLPPEELKAGMEEFTSRFNLDLKQFEVALAQGGVSMETFRDFVEAGLLWRTVVRERYRGKIVISDDDVERRLDLSRPGAAGVRVLLSEIILPAQTPAQQRAASARATEIAEIKTLPAFASAARRYSASPSKGRSGRLDWMDLSNMPPALAAQVLPLSPGMVTDPIPVQNAIALFQMRAIEETEVPAPTNVTIDYATYLIPGGNTSEAQTTAANLRARANTCDDLYGLTKGASELQLTRQAQPINEVPTTYALELAKLDPGEASSSLTTSDGQNLVFLMLCSRNRDLPEEVSRDEVRLQLLNERLQTIAKGYLEELRAAAYIKDVVNK
ncbi:peptidylprolyl isomerase [Aliiroseovarius crassostreae]|uniref:peptidylprolyl isomerase n=1 Tax=Aliiroseovarius crassostreae TaxID=154981 RepID=UPI003C7E05D1